MELSSMTVRMSFHVALAVSAGPLKDYPNINIVRGDMWGEKCFNCVFKMIKATLAASDRKSERILGFVLYFSLHRHTFTCMHT